MPITGFEEYIRPATVDVDVATLRFITCGSVDDGKSTLIGRLLYESKCIFDDQLQALEADSKQYGTQGDRIDFARSAATRCLAPSKVLRRRWMQ